MSFFDRWQAKIIVTSVGIPATGAACQYRNEVRIMPHCADDAGLIAHELTHVKQWQMCISAGASFFAALGACILWPFGAVLGLMAVLPCEKLHGYLYSRFEQYRLWAEIQAYRAQLKHYPERTDSIAEWLASDASGYRFNITKSHALALLIKGA